MTSPKKEASEFLALCGKVRDGDATPAEFSRLEARLLHDPQALNTYRQFMAICSGLEQTAIVQQSPPKRNELVADLGPTTQSSPSPGIRRAKIERPPVRLRRRKIAIAVAAIATVAALIMFAIIRFDGGFDDDRTETGSFATVASVHQPVWGDKRALLPSELVEAGEYFMASGAVQVNYANGAELLVQAPSQFSLHEENRVTLSSGVASLFIPPAATGFRIDTPFGSAIDHGTRIGVVADAASGIELHVFEGKAELVAVGASEGTMLEANTAAAIDAESKTVTSIDAEQAYFARSLDELSGLPVVSGDVELRVSPPRSVRRVRAESFDVGTCHYFCRKACRGSSKRSPCDSCITRHSNVGISQQNDLARWTASRQFLGPLRCS